MSRTNILVVEDEAIVARSIQSELEGMGYSVPTTASSGEEAIQKAEGLRPDLVLMDVVLRGDMDGIQAAQQIRSRLDIPIVYLTAYEDDETLGRAKVTEPFGYLLKPFEEKELHSTIEMALYKHRMDLRIKETERWLTATLQSIADAVIATDARLGIRVLNPVAEALTGWSSADAFGKDLSEVCRLFHEDAPTVVESLAVQAIRERVSMPLDHRSVLVARDGSETPVEGSLAPIHDDDGNLTGVVLVLRDVSARRQLEQAQRQNEEQRRQTEKMEAVSRLAGGVAHDFNNLLTAVLGNTSLARSRLPRDHPSADLLVAAETATERAAQRVKQLLGVSGQAFLHLKPLNLSTVLREMEGAIRRSVPPQVAVELRLADDLWTVQADPSQVREALFNLCRNAQEAMPAGGQLTVQTENVSIAADELRQPRAQAGEYVRLRIQDTGPGIAPEIRSRIFEPFFTTKEPDQGNGLGLALAHGIIEQHHGWIECSSEAGRGACFDVFLPCYAHPRLTPPVPVTITKAQRNSTTTILLADDERMIRDLARAILENQGYQVLLAEDGAQAVELFERDRHLIDLVILDLTMPRLSGNDACRQILDIEPGVRVLFSSGYFAEELTTGEDGNIGFIKKPYRHDALVQAVQASLDQAGVARRDVLLMLAKRLERALAADWVGRERDWTERVILVLDRVEQMIRQHALEIESDEPVEGIDGSQLRRMDGLRSRYGDFLERATQLQQNMQRVARVLDRIHGIGEPADAPSPEPVALDIDTIRGQLEEFRRELEEHRQEEIDAVMQSVTTDFGGGD